MTVSAPTRLTEILRGSCALLTSAVLLAGVPTGLYAVAGSPIPDHVPSWEQVAAVLLRPDTDNWLFLSAVRLLGWTAWAVFVAATCAETVSHLAGRTLPALPRPVRPMQLLARDLVAAVTLIFSTALAFTTPASAATQTTADTEPTNGPSTTPSQNPGWEPFLGEGAPPTPDTEQPAWQTRIVHRGDTLWSLARRAYGSGSRYTKIFKASRAIDQPPGVPALTDPDEISPGQQLRIPSGPTKAGDPEAEQSTRQERPPRSEQHRTHDHPTHALQQGRPTSRSHPAEVPTPIVAPPVENPPSSPEPSTPAPSTRRSADQGQSSITLPSGSRIGIGLAAALSLAVAMTRLHRRRRHTTSTDDVSAEQFTPPPEPVAQARKAHLDRTYTDHDAPIPSDADLAANDRATPPPDHITLGTRDDAPITLPLAGLTLGLTGDGAHAAARAITTELLAKAPRDRAELLIPQPAAVALYPGAVLEGIPGLTLTPTLTTATAHLQAEAIHRARLMETADEPDVTALRAADPAEPLPTLLLAATAPARTAATLHAITQFSHTYGLGTLLLGPAPTGTTLHLTDDATVTHAEGPHADALVGARLFHLTAHDANAMLHSLRTATGAPEPETSTVPRPRPDPARDQTPQHDDTATSESFVPSIDHDRAPPIRLQVLGSVHLHTAQGPITTGVRRDARDLLAYLALNPNGVTREQAVTALWSSQDPHTTTTTFNTAIANIRRTLRAATGLREPMYVIHTAGRYRLDPGLIEVDEQHLAAALTGARHATTDADRIAALTRVTDLYTDEFAAGFSYGWAENHREHLRRAVTDALTRLARLLQHDHPEEALAALERAVTLDPYAEPLYRTIMQLQTQLGHPDAAERTYQLLTTHLIDIDAEPNDQTHELRTKLQQHR
ncbi:hypothetical protein GCM10022254_75030 [Actinomadura meridiana]|uniref:LysM domain-containing protein n=1 Tax=Actinomadura meridiana TaxID=559626 RepID=A0ABP8CQW2_9ACTN